MKLRAALFTLATAVPLLGWWEPDVRLTFNDSASYTSRNSARAMAAGGETLHVVWYDQRDGNREIYYKRSVDRGTTWSSDRRLTSNSAVSRTPSVVVAGADIHVVWYDERDGNREIYHKRSPDRGLTWYADTRLTADTARSYNSSVAAAGDCVHVVWMQDSASVYPDIWYRRSTDRGQTWQPPVRLTDDAERSYNPAVAAGGSSVHVVWADFRHGNWEVMYRRSTDAGAGWEPEQRLTEEAAASEDPGIAAAGEFAHVAWYDERDGNQEVYYRRSTDRGATWEPEQRLTSALLSSHGAAVAADSVMVHVAWTDLRDGDKELYYRRSTSAGADWEPEARLTDDSGASQCPGVAAGGAAVHVVWYDDRDGNCEVYYKRNPNGNTGVETAGRRAAPRRVATVGDVLPASGPGVAVYDAGGRRLPAGGRVPAAGVYFVTGGGCFRQVVARPR